MNFDPTAMNILQDADFDPMAILHGDEKLDSTKPIVKVGAGGGDDNNDDSGADDDPPAGKQTPKPAPPKSGPAPITLSDDDILQGLQKAKGVKPAVTGGNNDDNTDDANPDAGKAKGKQTDSANPFALHYQMMVDAGEWEAVEGFDGSEEKYIEARNANLEKQAMAMTEGWFSEAFQSNPDGAEMGKKLFDHLRNGGKVSDFVQLMAPSEIDYKALDSEDEVTAESVAKDLINRYYSSIGWKPERISTRISSLQKTGQLVDEAKQIEEPYKDLVDLQAKQYNEQLKVQAERQRQHAQKMNASLQTMIESNHSFGSLKLWKDKKDKEALTQYLFTLDPETKRTPFSNELNEGLKDPNFLLFVANALRNKLHQNPDGLIDTSKATQSAASSMRDKLSQALLNKRIDSSDNSGFQNDDKSKGSSKFKFELDKAVVIS